MRDCLGSQRKPAVFEDEGGGQADGSSGKRKVFIDRPNELLIAIECSSRSRQ